MEIKDIEAVAALHINSLAEYEFSVKLGEKFLRDGFYYSCVKSDLAIGYVYEVENRLIAFAVGFWNYTNFNKNLRQSKRILLAKEFAKAWFQGRIGLADFKDLWNHQLEKATSYDAHLGAFALAEDYKRTPVGALAILNLCNAILKAFEKRGLDGCWGVTDQRNLPTQKVLQKLHFSFVRAIDLPSKTVFLYERHFKK